MQECIGSRSMYQGYLFYFQWRRCRHTQNLKIVANEKERLGTASPSSVPTRQRGQVSLVCRAPIKARLLAATYVVKRWCMGLLLGVWLRSTLSRVSFDAATCMYPQLRPRRRRDKNKPKTRRPHSRRLKKQNNRCSRTLFSSSWW